MTTLALSLIAKFWPFFLAALGAAWAVFKAYRAGAAKERARQDKAEASAIHEASEIQNDVGAMPPDAVREELARRARR